MTVHIGSVGPPIRANTMEPEVYRQLIGIHGDMSIAAGPPQGIIGTGDFSVTQNGTPNMSVNVGAGFACIAGTNNSPVQGVYNAYNDASVNVIVPTANASFPRIDVICLTIQDAFYSGATNTALLQDIAGVAAASPTVPAVPANSLPLAHIYVGAAVGSILNANINTTSGTNNPDTVAFRPSVMPPACMASSVTTAAQSGLANGTVLNGCSQNVNVNNHRNILVGIRGNFSISAAGFLSINIFRDATQISSWFVQTAGAAQASMCDYAIDSSPSTGMHLYTVQIGVSAGTGSTNSSATNPVVMYVSDIGPSS